MLGPVKLALLLYVVAWFLPVIEDGATLADGTLPGWQAMMVALSPIWDWSSGGKILERIIFVLSGSTNFVFVGAAALRWRRPTWRPEVVTRAVFVAAAIDCYWLGYAIQNAAMLYPGYYAWLASFFLLGAYYRRR